jgi:hypothetical protein
MRKAKWIWAGTCSPIAWQSVCLPSEPGGQADDRCNPRRGSRRLDEIGYAQQNRADQAYSGLSGATPVSGTYAFWTTSMLAASRKFMAFSSLR